MLVFLASILRNGLSQIWLQFLLGLCVHFNILSACLLLPPWKWLQSIVMSMSVCLSVREDISGTTCSAIFTMCMLPMSVAQSSCGMLRIGCVTYRREGGDGSAQLWQSVIYDGPVGNVIDLTRCYGTVLFCSMIDDSDV